MAASHQNQNQNLDPRRVHLLPRLLVMSSLGLLLCASLLYLLSRCCEADLPGTSRDLPGTSRPAKELHTKEFLLTGRRWYRERTNGTRLDGGDAVKTPLLLAEASSSSSPGLESNSSGKEEWTAPPSRRLPHALIIGVKKGGTRALLEFLRLHPDVRALGSEPHFFDRHYARGLEWYRSLMPRALEGQVVMEKTPRYFVTAETPARVAAMSRDVRLIVVVRDPVTRAISDYTQIISKTPHIPTFETLTFRNRTTGEVDSQWSPLWIGLYADHLQRWLAWFPRQQIHLVSGERLVTDPAGELARVQDFLGLQRIVTDKHFYFNRTKGFPCLKKPEGSGKPHCLGKTKGRAHARVHPAVLRALRDFYRPHNLRFYRMAGQDFGWQ